MTRSQASTDLRRRTTVISDGIGAVHRAHYGRGAGRIRTVIHQDVVMTSLDDCYTTVEKKMIAEGAFLQVRETRTMFQDWIGPHFVDVVEARPAGR